MCNIFMNVVNIFNWSHYSGAVTSKIGPCYFLYISNSLLHNMFMMVSQSRYLHLVVNELIKSCDKLTTTQGDDTTDMPQVHSLNILKALVVDAKLTGAIRCYLAPIAILCISSFSSTVWALRNAATQLFGKYLTKLTRICVLYFSNRFNYLMLMLLSALQCLFRFKYNLCYVDWIVVVL